MVQKEAAKAYNISGCLRATTSSYYYFSYYYYYYYYYDYYYYCMATKGVSGRIMGLGFSTFWT